MSCIELTTEQQVYAQELHESMKLHIPKVIAKIKMFGDYLTIEVTENSGFVMPNKEQRKNLKEMLMIEVEEVKE